GWAIETGIWYSPFIVHDLDGDGKAEVIAKTGGEDPRDEDGRVQTGAEWLTVFSGETGKKMASAPWPDREGLRRYARICRNQMAVGFLDGKTPCILALRGTYGRMKVDAYEFHDGELRQLWRFDNEKLSRRYWGQGEHFTRCVDVDGDGRDEVVLGSMVLDDNGVPLWTIGMGHPDHVYVGDIDPHRPGLEMYYGVETRARRNGMCLVDAPTGKILWAFDEPTRHIHGKGICADLDPTVPGLECFGLDCMSKKPDIRRGPWMWAANGKLLWYEEGPLPKTYGVNTAYWDADLQKEILRGGIRDYRGGKHGAFSGSLRLVADLYGDWREEIVTSVPGEVRIYSTTIPATDRRVSLLQDPIYRGDTVMNTMGYSVMPMTSFNLEAHWPGLNAIVSEDEPGSLTGQVVVSAPLDCRVSGTVTFAGDGLVASPGSVQVDVAPGRRVVHRITLASETDRARKSTLWVELQGTVSRVGEMNPAVPRPADFASGRPVGTHPLRLKVGAPVRVASRILTGGIRAEAEDIAAQSGGKVRVRKDKKGVCGKAISHWDDTGHAIEWKISVPKSGRYALLVRYSTPNGAKRSLTVDGRDTGEIRFSGTGGFGSAAGDWDHKEAAKLTLVKGTHTFRLENVDGQGLNLDYLVLQPLK
ncbi:MAG: hypothetical protein KAI66_17245, partial [Lentisphaeria bacterium]|nr:hypothetical protein [Lentisphaeria bacterium]